MTFPQDAAVSEALAWIDTAPASTASSELVARLDLLPYAARVRAVSQWANRHRDEASAAATIKDLSNDSPSGAPVELSVDGEISNLFPAQRTAVSAKFHVHQAGLFAAAASDDCDTLKEAATSASRLMKKLAVKEATRLLSDRELDVMIRAALPTDRKEFLHQCMRFRKHAVLDAVFEAVIELDGESVAARVLHGLSSAGVAKHLPGVITNKRLLWPKLWRFHEPVLLAQLGSELQAAHRLAVADVWTKWQPFFTSPLVRQTHHRIWRQLLALFLEHRPVNICCHSSLHKKMIKLSKEGKLPEDAETVAFVTPSWVRREAFQATVRDLEAQDPSATLLGLVRSSMANLQDDDDMDDDAPKAPVELRHGSLAVEALSALLTCAEAVKKFRYPLEAVLCICKSIIERAPLSFVYDYKTPEPRKANAVAAYTLAMSTLNRILSTSDCTISDVEAVVAIGHDLATATSPTPARLGIDLHGSTLLSKIVGSSAIKSIADTWLQLNKTFWQRSVTVLCSRGCEMAKKKKDVSTICAAMSSNIASLKDAHLWMGERSDEYAKIWPELEGFGIGAMMSLAKWLTSSQPAEYEESTQVLREVYRAAASAIVKETFLPHWRRRFMFDRGDEHSHGGPATAVTRRPWKGELEPLKDISGWLRCQRHTADMEPLLCEVLKVVTDWSDWVFADRCSGKAISNHAEWKAAADSVLSLCQQFQDFALTDMEGEQAVGTGKGMPKLAAQSFEAVLEALKLFHYNKSTGDPLEGSVLLHSEQGYIAALKRLPESLRSDPSIKSPAVEMILSQMAQTLAEKDSDARSVLYTIEALPNGIKELVVTSALVPGGALNGISATLKQELHAKADLSNPDVNKLLRKATDDSQVQRRIMAMATLLSCAARSEDMTLMSQTLSFVASRIQNETAASRDAVLRHVFELCDSVCEASMSEARLTSGGTHDEDAHTGVWLRLLEDLTCSADFEESSSLHLFSRAGAQMLNGALQSCVDNTGDFRSLSAVAKAWAELGAELIWRVHVAQHGPKKAAEMFSASGLSLSSSTLKAIKSSATCLIKKAEAEKKAGVAGADNKIATLQAQLQDLVELVYQLYHARLQTSAPVTEGSPQEAGWEGVEGVDSLAGTDIDMDENEGEPLANNTGGAVMLRAFGCELMHLQKLVELTGRFYVTVPLLQNKLESVVSMAQSAGHSALRYIEQFVSVVISQHTKLHPWQRCPVLVSYHDTLLRRFGTHGFGMERTSTRAFGGYSGPVVEPETFLGRWLSIHLPRKEEKASMGRATFQARKAAAVAALLNMSPSAIHIKLVWRFLVCHRQDLLGDYINPDGSHFPGIFHPSDGGKELEERAGAATVLKSTSSFSSGDLEEDPEPYQLPATFGLRKLLQPQVAVLAERWKAMALDTEISATQRTRGAARYCSNPAVAFSDQVETINELWSLQTEQLAIAKEAAAEEAAAAAAVTAADVTGDRTVKAEAVAAVKAARTKKAAAMKASKVILPLPVSEALLEGMMRGDEPTAPFGFLLSPQMLARTEARVTMQVLNRAIGMIPPTDIAKFASVLLGNREVRRAMKVTVHKALLRLLRHSTDEGPLLVLREWKRKELHRDVRIVILQCALELLHASGSQTGEEVWTILESAAADQDIDPVVKTVLLVPDRTKAPQPHALPGAGDGLSKLAAQCTACADVHEAKLPAEVEARYFSKVLCVIDEAELSARAKYAELAEAAAAEIGVLKGDARNVGKKKQLGAAATALAEAQARGCAADNLRALLATTLARWGAAPERAVAVAKMLSESLRDEDTAVLNVDQGSESAGRNTAMFRLLPDALSLVCLRKQQHPEQRAEPETSLGLARELRGILEAAVTSLAERVMSVSLGERAVRNASFERLVALHDAVLQHSAGGRRAADSPAAEEILRSALAPMAWLRAEASQMAALANKRLPTEQEQRQAKVKKQRRGAGW